LRHPHLLLRRSQIQRGRAHVLLRASLGVLKLSLTLRQRRIRLRNIGLDAPRPENREIHRAVHQKHTVRIARWIHTGGPVVGSYRERRIILRRGRPTRQLGGFHLRLRRPNIVPSRERLPHHGFNIRQRQFMIGSSIRQREGLRHRQSNQPRQRDFLFFKIVQPRCQPLLLGLQFHLAAIHIDARVQPAQVPVHSLLIHRLCRFDLRPRRLDASRGR
jgi:hypothetical protein